jgi:MerR family mercuric resistance operon transcriptional regulator
MTQMTISQLARAGGVGVETIRFYQRRGLLDVPDKTGGTGPIGGMRRYGVTDLRKLRFIRGAKAAGLTLDQIGDLLRLDAGEDRARVRILATERIAALDQKIAELEAARSALGALARDCAASNEGPCPILQAFERG